MLLLLLLTPLETKGYCHFYTKLVLCNPKIPLLEKEGAPAQRRTGWFIAFNNIPLNNF